MTEQTNMTTQSLKSILESIFFMSEKALPLDVLVETLNEFPKEEIVATLEAMITEMDHLDRGIFLTEVANGYQFRTKTSNAPWLFKLNKAKPVKLSKSTLETLAIIAYRQPITRPEMDEIRGVDSGYILRTLLERNLIKILGKREEAGNPLIYGTTNDFLSFFGLKNLSDLPTLREYTELAQESLEKLEQMIPPSNPVTAEEEAALMPPEVPTEEPVSVEN